MPEWNITEASEMKVPESSQGLDIDKDTEGGNLSPKTTLSTEVVLSSPIPYPDNLSDTTSIALSRGYTSIPRQCNLDFQKGNRSPTSVGSHHSMEDNSGNPQENPTENKIFQENPKFPLVPTREKSTKTKPCPLCKKLFSKHILRAHIQVCCVDSDDSCSVASLPPTLQLIIEDKGALARDVQQPSPVKQPSPIQQSSPVQQPSLVGMIKPEVEFQPGTTPQTY